jgi:hypothetical protein
MTIGYENSSSELHPSVKWVVGGTTSVDTKVTKDWEGSDGRQYVNAYDCTYYKDYRGWVYARQYGYTWSPELGGHYAFIGEAKPFVFFWKAFPWLPTVMTGTADVKAAAALVNHIVNTDFRPNLAIAEGPETLKYIWSKFKPIVTSVKALKKGDIRRAARALGMRSNWSKVLGKSYKNIKRAIKDNDTSGLEKFWLEYRYALTPLVLDVSSGMNLLFEQQGKPRSLRIAKSASNNRSVEVGSSDWPDALLRESTKYTVTLKEDFDYRELDFNAIAPAVWELIPYSFMVDWALNIGDYLRSRRFFHFSQMTEGCRTRILRGTSGQPKALAPNASYPENGYTVNTWKSSNSTQTVIQRRPWDGVVPLPQVKNPLTESSHWKRILDGTAIINGLNRRAPRG